MTATPNPLQCTSCLQIDGVEDRLVIGVAVDPISGLCLHCQPCSRCGRTGTGCVDDHGGMNYCDPVGLVDHLAAMERHLELGHGVHFDWDGYGPSMDSPVGVHNRLHWATSKPTHSHDGEVYG